MGKRTRSASPIIPRWPDVISLSDLRGIREHWAERIAAYEEMVQEGATTWARHLTIARERHALWMDLVTRRENGEKITERFYDFLRVQ